MGIAARGNVPFLDTFACFFSRAYDQVRMAAISRSHVKLCGSHCGVSIGEDGPSQMGLEDLAMFRAIPGATCASQLETVQRWYDTGQRDHQQVRAVGYGTRPASAIEQAVGARAADQDWEQRLADALTAFRDCRWPLDYLRPAAGLPGRGRRQRLERLEHTIQMTEHGLLRGLRILRDQRRHDRFVLRQRDAGPARHERQRERVAYRLIPQLPKDPGARPVVRDLLDHRV